MKKIFLIILLSLNTFAEDLNLILTCEGTVQVNGKSKNASPTEYVNLSTDKDTKTYEFRDGMYVLNDDYFVTADITQNEIEVNLKYQNIHEDQIDGIIRINRISGEVFNLSVITPKKDGVMLSQNFKGFCKKSARQF